MFLHVSVILFRGGGICPITCWDTPPPGPEAGTPLDQRQSHPTGPGRHPHPLPQDQAPCTRHPLGPGTSRSRHTPLEQTNPPGADTPPKQTHPASAVHAGTYGQQAGGMHPTGMQSCLGMIFHVAKSKVYTKCRCSPPEVPNSHSGDGVGVGRMG